MRVTLAYGLLKEEVDIPDSRLMGIATSPDSLEPSGSEADIIAGALAEPIESPPLHELAGGKSSACILISDHTRPTPSRRLLPFLLRELERGGITTDRVSVVIATGLHEPPDKPTVQKMLGAELLSSLRVVVHDPDDVQNLVDIGTTSHGTPVQINRLAAQADLLISVSTVEPHLTYGWSGGAKNIIPGISSRRTVYAHHGRAIPKPGLNNVEGSVFRADAEEAGGLAGLRFILNVLLNEKRQLLRAFAGHPVWAHRAAVAVGRKINVVEYPSKADIVICALGGSPRDADFWQAQGKGLMHVGHMVRDGGILILAAGCEMGMGAEQWAGHMRASMEEIERWYSEREYSVPLMKAFDTVTYLRRAALYLVTPGVKPEEIPQLPVQFFSTVREALNTALQRMADCQNILVVPDSSRVVVSTLL